MTDVDNNLAEITDKTRAKLLKLDYILQDRKPLAIAFSGGVDSTFLLKYSHNLLGDDVIAVTAKAINFAPDEMSYAEQFCRENGIRHIVAEIDWSKLQTIAYNPPNRCYFCKKLIFTEIIEMLNDPENYAVSSKLTPGAKYTIVDGSNADDTFDYRPGERALRELGVISPLADAELTKPEIRGTLKSLGLPIWNKPAFACLASRVPYGEEITPEKLTAVYTVEKALREAGLTQVRVRYHEGNVARIEVLAGEMPRFFNLDFMAEINSVAKAAGFDYAALDLGGYKMGNLNKNIKT